LLISTFTLKVKASPLHQGISSHWFKGFGVTVLFGLVLHVGVKTRPFLNSEREFELFSIGLKRMTKLYR